jgi:hypothetical protein
MENEILQKFITDENSKVGWLAVIDSGWILRDGARIHNKYKAANILKGEDFTFKVVCLIPKSTISLPFYRITAFKLLDNGTFSSNVEVNLTGLKVTSISNKIIKVLNVQTNKLIIKLHSRPSLV